MLIWRDSHDNDVPCIELHFHAHTTAIVRLCKRRADDYSYEIPLVFPLFVFALFRLHIHQRVKINRGEADLALLCVIIISLITNFPLILFTLGGI